MIPKLLRHLFLGRPRARAGWLRPAGWEQLEERKLLTADPAVAELEETDLPDFAEADPAAPGLNSGTPNGARHDLSELPAFSSLPGASATVYLDFTGHDEAAWGTYQNVHTPVFDLDGDPTTFSDRELAVIESVWRQVAEDFAPFNLNVTTVAPPSFGDHEAIRVAIGGASSDWYGNRAGGVAFVGGFYNSGSNTAYVFSSDLSNSAKNIALVASHEAGHTFGLQHQSLYDSAGTQITEHNSGNANWAPIMGTAYTAQRGTWALGTSTSATTIQDDMAIIAGPWNGFGFRADDHPDDPAQGTLLNGNTLTASGVIETATDADWFTFATTGGTWDITVHTASTSPNLLGYVVLQSSDGTIVTSAILGGSGTLHADLSAGLYRLAVLSNGEYGSAGQYALEARTSGNSGGLIAQGGLAGATPLASSIPLPANLLNGVPVETGSLRLNQLAQFASQSRQATVDLPRAIPLPEPERQSAGGGSSTLRSSVPQSGGRQSLTPRPTTPPSSVTQTAVSLENPEFEMDPTTEQPVMLEEISTPEELPEIRPR